MKEAYQLKEEAISQAKQVYDMATPVQKELDGIVSDISKTLHLPYEPVEQKSIDSVIDKLARKRAAGQAYEIWDMKDHARQRLLLNDFFHKYRRLKVF